MIDNARHTIQALRDVAARFATSTRAVAAVEFGLILPILAVLYLGSIELTNALTVNRKVSQAANTIGDLVAQYRSIDANTMTDIFTASAAIMTPYSNSGLIISVAGIEIDKDGKLSVKWSRKNSGGGAPGLIDEVPDALKTPNSFLIVAKTEYNYRALFANFSADTLGTDVFALSDVFFLRPRIGNEVKYTP